MQIQTQMKVYNDIYFTSGINEKILKTIADWRILDLQTLYRILSLNIGYIALTKRIRKLEKIGFLKSYYYFFKNQKYVYASNKLLQEIIQDGSSEIIKEHLDHDLIL